MESVGDGYNHGQVINSSILIPSDCTHVEYLSKFAFTANQKGVMCGNQTANYGNPRTYLFYTNSAGGTTRQFYCGSAVGGVTLEAGDAFDWKVVLDGQSQTLDVYKESILAFSHATSGEFLNHDIPIHFFGGVHGTAVDDCTSMKIWYFKIIHGSTLVRDYIPVRFTNELGQSEGAMYDRVSRKLFRNAGTGSFIIGPDVATPVMGLHFMRKPTYKMPEGFRQVKYIVKDESTSSTSGLCMFQTGIYNNSDWYLETDGYCSVSTSAWFWYGAFYATGTWKGYGFFGNYAASRPVHGESYGSYWTSIGTGAGGNIMKCNCSATGISIDWNGTIRNITSSVGFNNAEIYLMGNGIDRSVGNNTGMGETVIKKGGIEMAHLFPCVRISDNAHVFYDAIQKVVREKVGTAKTRVIEFE